jgi:O-antigen ligase
MPPGKHRKSHRKMQPDTGDTTTRATSAVALTAQCVIALIVLSTPFGMRAFAWTAFLASVFGWLMVLLHLTPKSPGLLSKEILTKGLCWFGLGLLYLALHGMHYRSLADLPRLDAPARLFLFTGIVFLPMLSQRGPGHFSKYFSIAGILFGAIPLLQHLQNPVGDRAFGLFQYENLMALAAVVNAAMIVWYNDGRSQAQNYLHLLGIIGSLTACLLSGTRTAWVLLPLVLIPAYRMYSRSHERKHLKRKIGLALVITGLTVFFFASDSLYQRVHVSAVDLKNTFSGDASGSIGLRLLMVNMAVEKIQLHPLLGNGLGEFHQSIVRWADTNQLPIHAMERNFQNPHNQFLHWAMALGIPAALACVAICIAWPLLVTRQSTAVARSALWSFMVCCTIFFVTEAVLDRYHGASWYAATLSLTLGFCLRTNASLVLRFTKTLTK